MLTPDPEGDPDQRIWEPRYFSLETEMVLRSTTANEKGQNPVMPTTINLDIESLNRHERQFIIDHRRPLWVTPCRASVLGHFNQIVSRHSDWTSYVGIVADQVDIAPLTWGTARPDWVLSSRSLMRAHEK
jgi:hypothetical protein